MFITSQTAVIGLQRHFIIGEQEDIRMISAGYEFGGVAIFFDRREGEWEGRKG